MGLNSTQAQQTRRAAAELREKVALEKPFRRELLRLFKRVGKNLGQTIENTGGSISSANYSNDLRVVMERNYKRVQRKFTREIINFLVANRNNLREAIIVELSQIADARGSTLNETIKRIRQNTINDLAAFRDFNIGISVNQIIQTTQKEIDVAITKAEQELREELAREPTNKELGKKARQNFDKRQAPRAAMIAATEVQKVAEGTKQLERDQFLGERNNSTAIELELTPREPKEVWVTQGDSLVRDGDGTRFNHLAADGQIKINGVYNVSGELLRFPGDITLGASAGNVIRCRCSSVTVID